jgi:hypothetical protein
VAGPQVVRQQTTGCFTIVSVTDIRAENLRETVFGTFDELKQITDSLVDYWL